MATTIRNGILALFLGLTICSSCRKEPEISAAAPPGAMSPAPGTLSDKLKDTTLLFSKDIYLWYEQIPPGFNARSYNDPAGIMTSIRLYSNEPGFAGPVDRWSFAVKQTEWDKVSAGVAADFGLGVFFYSPNDLRVKSVEKESPAGRAGVRRGWRITRINNNSNITTGNTDFVATAVFNSTSTAFTFQKRDSTFIDVTLNAATYQEQPNVFDSVYTTSAGKLGYLVLNSFLGDTTKIYNEFIRIFNRFAASGVSKVAVDLRYNGGGYVSVQEKLANYLIKAGSNGSVMMKQQFNSKYTQYNEVSVFSKLGSVNAEQVFFIVSGSTASASELLINSLTPHMNVSLVGPGKTYGKPVGFFPIPVGDWYIFPVSFRTTNSNNEGSYFGGLPLNFQAADGLNKDWGSVEEAALGSVLKYLNTGSFRNRENASESLFTEYPQVITSNRVLDKQDFKGVIDTRGLK